MCCRVTDDEEDIVALEVPDSWGLEGKVAIVTGGGAAGDGIGNGRAAAILLARAGAQVLVVDRDAGARRAHRRDDRAEGGDGGRASRPTSPTRPGCAAMVEAALDRFGRLDFLDNNVGIGSRGTVVDETAGDLAPRDAGERRDHVPRLQARHPGDDQTAGRRRHRQHLVDLGAAPARAHRLLDLEGRGDRAHARDGGGPRPRRHPRQLRRARPRLHADGLRAAA